MCVGNEGTNVLTERCQCVYAAFHMRIENFCKVGFKRMGCWGQVVLLLHIVCNNPKRQKACYKNL